MALNDKLITYGNLSAFYDNLKSHDLADKQNKLTAGDNVTLDENGNISVDLSAYAVKSELPTKLTDLTNDGNFVRDAKYVHTDNNYTTAHKNKLIGIEDGAEVNVQSDWNVTDITSDAFIKHKPQNLVQDANYVHTDNNFTTDEKTKLAGLENYELPQASASTLGGIKVGANLSIDFDGVLSAEDSDAIVGVDTLPEASESTKKFYRLSTDNKVYMSMSNGNTPSDSDQIDNANFHFYIPDAFFTWDYYYKGAVNVQCSDGTITLYRWWTDDTSYFTKLSATDQVIETPYLSSFLGAKDSDLGITNSTGVYSTTKTVEQVQTLVNVNLAASNSIVLHKLEAGYTWKSLATEDEIGYETATTADIEALFA